MKSVNYSFIIPVFKSVATLRPLYLGISDLMKELQSSFEVLYIEDGGSDDSWNELLKIKAEFPETVILLKLTRNFGQNGATLCGIDEAKGDYLVTLDDDLQVKPSEIKKLITCMELQKMDVVYGMHDGKTGSWIRRAGSAAIKRIFTQSEGGSNIGSSIRLINSNIASHLRNHSQDHLFINQVVSWYTFNTGFVEVNRSERSEGRSGYNLWQLFLIAFRLLFLYTSIPLRLMIVVCIVSSVTSLGLAGYYIYRHFVLGQGLGFLVLIVVAISLILASISIMGVYLNRLYSARVRKPHYAIKIKL